MPRPERTPPLAQQQQRDIRHPTPAWMARCAANRVPHAPQHPPEHQRQREIGDTGAAEQQGSLAPQHPVVAAAFIAPAAAGRRAACATG